jgi:D-3-phosphoglycerate dehydrogenase
VNVVGADASQVQAALADADALLVRTHVSVTADMVAAAPRLRVIGRGGIGLDNIDLVAARARGITVVYTPAASTRSVAEHTWGLILAVERRIVQGDAAVRGGAFMEARQRSSFREVGGLTVGVVGMGRIGTAVGRIGAAGFGARVIYNDIVAVGPFDFPARAVSKEQLWAESDIITLHVPLTPLTRGLIDTEVLAKCKAGAVVINTARGAVVDAAALAEGLSTGRLAGAGIDVFDEEPVPAEYPLLAAPNVVMSPHVASRSAEALARMNDVVDDVVNVLSGRSPRYAAPREG